MTSKLRGRP